MKMNRTLTISILREVLMNKSLKFVKIKCECGHVNLVPIIKTLHVYEPIKCEKCGKTLAITE